MDTNKKLNREDIIKALNSSDTTNLILLYLEHNSKLDKVEIVEKMLPIWQMIGLTDVMYKEIHETLLKEYDIVKVLDKENNIINYY